MRSLSALLLVALCACSSEPDFDEKYEDTQKQIEAKLKELDAELAERAEAEE